MTAQKIRVSPRDGPGSSLVLGLLVKFSGPMTWKWKSPDRQVFHCQVGGPRAPLLSPYGKRVEKHRSMSCFRYKLICFNIIFNTCMHSPYFDPGIV